MLDIKELLRGFLSGMVPLSEVLEKLQAFLVVDFEAAPQQREMKLNLLEGQLELQVRSDHLRGMLNKYIAGQISEQVLSDWAAFVLMAQVFVPEGQTETEREEAGEGPVWDILQRLTTPAVFGGLSPQVARQYLALLN